MNFELERSDLTVVSVCAFVQQPSYGSDYTFYCDGTTYGSQSVPATMARTNDGRRVMIVRWVSQYFSSKLSNKDRCNIVSRRFQKFYDHGKLVYINGGYVIIDGLKLLNNALRITWTLHIFSQKRHPKCSSTN